MFLYSFFFIVWKSDVTSFNITKPGRPNFLYICFDIPHPHTKLNLNFSKLDHISLYPVLCVPFWLACSWT